MKTAVKTKRKPGVFLKANDSIAEKSGALPVFLFVTGAVICGAALLESYLQLSGSPFSLLDLAHRRGFLLQYERSTEPNKGLWLPAGMIGSGCFILMMMYSVRKRAGFLMNMGSLGSWLDVHMFLGIVGAALVTAHTTFKIGGLVSVSYWSMMIVALSGLVGRYLYGWIPRKVSGKEMEIGEIRAAVERTDRYISHHLGFSPGAIRYYERITGPRNPGNNGAPASVFTMCGYDMANMALTMKIWFDLATDHSVPYRLKRRLFRLIRRKSRMIRAVNFLSTAQRLMHYWHVFHKPLAVTMFIVMFAHITVYYLFRVNV